MEPVGTHLLLIHCPDRPGLVYSISKILFEHRVNIVSNGEFVEREHNHFFMRTEFSGIIDQILLQEELMSNLPDNASIVLSPPQKKKIIILATKEYHCLGDLLLKSHYNDLNVQVVAVVSNYDSLRELASKFGVPYFFIDHYDKSRNQHEQQIDEVIEKLDPDLVVLAKYMRILSPTLVQKYSNRIINIHHSFLPAFVGANPYKKAYERGVKIIGATAHYVNDLLDEGPIIAQSVIPVDHTHNAKEMAQAGRDIEKYVLANALKLVCSERVFVFKNKTIIFD